MRCSCPICGKKVVQVRNLCGPNFCPHCHKLFNAPLPQKVPTWVFGVLLVLVANLQLGV